MATLARQLRQLTQLRCQIFETSYNPSSQRTGAKYLRARLRGPSMVGYYPERIPMRFVRTLAWDMDIVDPREEERLEYIYEAKMRGKGAPKKKKEKVDLRAKKKGGPKKK